MSAYPTDGGVRAFLDILTRKGHTDPCLPSQLYSASAYLVPKKYKAITGWIVGWLNLLGQVSAIASVEYSLSGMIMSAVSIGTNGTFVATTGQTVALFVGLLASHALLNSIATRPLAKITQTFVFINLGSLIAIVIACLATCKDFHPVSLSLC